MRIKAICLGMSKSNGDDSDMAIKVVRTNMRGRSDEKRQKFLYFLVGYRPTVVQIQS